MKPQACEVTILMPCLNEAETLGKCIQDAKLGLANAAVTGEILVADNGSTDRSAAIAEANGARVVHVAEKGYGSALRGGIKEAKGRWIIMGDADGSYDFSNISGFIARLREGHDLVMGCRLPAGGGRIMPGAMPWKNRWIGNPVLSFLGRAFFKSSSRDWHCGLRAFQKPAIEGLDLQTTGMEFASEMVIKAVLKSLRIAEVPIILYPDGRSRSPHLRPWRDGWRHLRFMLIYSPRWLFLVPGLLLASLGFIAAAVLSIGPVRIGNIQLDVGTLVEACMLVIVGVQLVAFAYFTKVFAIARGLLPADPKFSRLFSTLTLERGIAAGLLFCLVGLGLFARALWMWEQTGYGEIPYPDNLRRLVPSAAWIIVGIQIIFSSFFISVLGLRTVHRRPQ
ncbi:MAG: glycosyltransferase family 2 protein [Pseudomonadota bacterium]|nr:glycosyltransferase family 2 protein [Pseudomonadota bacterium]